MTFFINFSISIAIATVIAFVASTYLRSKISIIPWDYILASYAGGVIVAMIEESIFSDGEVYVSESSVNGNAFILEIVIYALQYGSIMGNLAGCFIYYYSFHKVDQ